VHVSRAESGGYARRYHDLFVLLPFGSSRYSPRTPLRQPVFLYASVLLPRTYSFAADRVAVRQDLGRAM
jgi:hypothetical protein